MFYSIVIPLFNRPDEIKELLESLTLQTYQDFEVVIVEDGSTIDSKEVVEAFKDRLDIQYFFKEENTRQGFTRNYGFAKAKGDYFIVFDSDCIIPPQYLQTVDEHLRQEPLDAFGGPDAAHDSFTDIQKAINYSMTSYFTTGGIRGRKKQLGPYHPRSFNMGISREVWEKTKGYKLTVKGEDIEFSIRIIEMGFKTGLIEDAYVFHKRRTNLNQYYKQLKFFGMARINVWTFYPGELKLVHFFPAMFLLYAIATILSVLLSKVLFLLMFASHTIYSLAILIDSTVKNKSLKVGLISVITSYIQLCGYGIGFISEAWKKVVLKQEEDIPEYPY